MRLATCLLLAASTQVGCAREAAPSKAPAHLYGDSLGDGARQGSLPPAEIQRVVREHFGAFRECYQVGVWRNSRLEGRVVVEFVIDRSGRVSSAEDHGSDISDPSVVTCVVAAYKKLVFPKPDGGSVDVVYPIAFRSQQ